MAKGVPTARSKSYKANIKLQEKTTSLPIKEKVHSPPSNSGNDVLPSPMTIPATDGAPRAFEMARVLTQTLMHMNPANHISDILKLLDLSISDCSAWYNEVYDRNSALQQQLDDLNSKMLAQDSDILNLQDQLKKSQVAQEFYRHQALKADMVPLRRRCRFVSSDADNALTLINCISNFFGLVMTFRFAIAPWNDYRFSTRNSKPHSSKCLLHLPSFSRSM
jgi:hypothetical protein